MPRIWRVSDVAGPKSVNAYVDGSQSWRGQWAPRWWGLLPPSRTRPSPRLVTGGRHRHRSWSNGRTESVLLGPTFSPPQPFHAPCCFCSLLPTSGALFRATSVLFWSKISSELVSSFFRTASSLARGSGTYFVLSFHMIFLIFFWFLLCLRYCKRSQFIILLSMWCGGEKSQSFC